MISILLEDSKNKLFQTIAHLSEERDLHIRKNINVLNKVEFKYTVYFSDVNNSIDNFKNKGYNQDLALYDRIIMDYNKDNPENMLTAWIM